MKSDLPSGGKFSVQFPLPGHVGFAPTQPILAFTKPEAVDSHVEQSSSEVNRISLQQIFLEVVEFRLGSFCRRCL